MSGAVPPLLQYAFIAWHLARKAQGKLYLFTMIVVYSFIL
jgi:hypothetical protein